MGSILTISFCDGGSQCLQTCVPCQARKSQDPEFIDGGKGLGGFKALRRDESYPNQPENLQPSQKLDLGQSISSPQRCSDSFPCKIPLLCPYTNELLLLLYGMLCSTELLRCLTWVLHCPSRACLHTAALGRLPLSLV